MASSATSAASGLGSYQPLPSGPARDDEQQQQPQLSVLQRISAICSSPPPVRPEGRWCPEEQTNWLTWSLFGWVTSLLRIGNAKPLQEEDLWDVAGRDLSEGVGSRVQQAWQAELLKDRPSLYSALWSVFGATFVGAGAIKLVHDCLQFASPLLLRLILTHIALPSASPSYGLLLAALLLLCNFLQTLCVHSYFHILFRMQGHLRVGVVSLIYSKALLISSTARQSTSLGEIVNLQSNDAEKVAKRVIYLHVIWSGPLQILGSLFLLFSVIGVTPSLAGIAVIFLLLPFNGWFMNLEHTIRQRLMTATDARVKMMAEVLGAMRTVKLYAWEQPFQRRIEGLRDAEVKEIRTSLVYESLGMFMYFITPVIVSAVSLLTYVAMGQQLTADVAFPALALFDIIRFPLLVLPDQLNDLVQARVSIARLEKFLGLPEVVPPACDPAAPVGSISIQNASFKWNSAAQKKTKEAEEKEKEKGGKEGKKEDGKETTSSSSSSSAPTLCNINLSIPPGQLLMVVGEVGAGKSSLLSAMLGEIEKLSGEVLVHGSIAYTSQDPWIQNATVEQNILLHHAPNPERFEQTLDACALRPDLATIPGGVDAEIGEKGINLSGGQKHRVALARAVFSDADIILLDDPLSAVDAHVGRHIFKSCIQGLLRGKTRVLVTHQLQFAQHADSVAVIRGGQIVAHGNLLELKAKGIDIASFFGEAVAAADEEEEEEEEQRVEGQQEEEGVGSLVGNEEVAEVEEGSSSSSDDEVSVETQDKAADAEESTPLLNGTGQAEKAAGKEQQAVESSKGGKGSSASGDASGAVLVREEARAVGKVKARVYLSYLKAWGRGFLMPLLVLLVFLLAQSVKLGGDAWLAIWTTHKGSWGHFSAWFYVEIYATLSVLTGVFWWLRGLLLAVSAVAAARTLHNSLLAHTLRLPTSFFDSQPTGRLISRFSRDMEAVDVALPNTLLSYLSCLFQVVFSLGIIIYATPLFVFPLVPLLLVYRQVQLFYVAASRELKRLDSLARSPIFAHFGETVSGLTTIRAFGASQSFSEQNHARLDRSTRAFIASAAANRWLGLRLELLGSASVFATAAFCVEAGGRLSPGFAGLALTNALAITSFMSWMVRMNAELETQMNSVERVLEYIDLPTEAPAVVEGNRPPEEWPEKGEIAAEQVVVRYRADLPPVLCGLSFRIGGGEKVGICGRTGCGKTTLLMTLYRIVEMESGCVRIDGIDISSIGLFDLRSKLALVPQDPVIFSGSVRDNLDPFHETKADVELWEALQKAGMAGVVKELPGQLDAELAEGGSNLSTGQRQLICMARALLRHAQILVLDEATSNVDHATDALIQETLRSSFEGCTILTIAHRLHTIMDYDRIMLLEAGQLAEFDTPFVLMEDPSSRFSGFVRQTMPEEVATVKKVASRSRIAKS